MEEREGEVFSCLLLTCPSLQNRYDLALQGWQELCSKFCSHCPHAIASDSERVGDYSAFCHLNNNNKWSRKPSLIGKFQHLNKEESWNVDPQSEMHLEDQNWWSYRLLLTSKFMLSASSPLQIHPLKATGLFMPTGGTKPGSRWLFITHAGKCLPDGDTSFSSSQMQGTEW